MSRTEFIPFFKQDGCQLLRAIFFDAVGTLLLPARPIAEVYAEIGNRHGSRLDTSVIDERFRRAFVREDLADRQMEWCTSEERERRRWRSIVSAVFDDVRDGEVCFQELFDHFAHPQSWRVAPGAGDLLRELSAKGFVLGMASNYDRRLRSVVAGFADLAPLRHLVISSEVRYRKPAGAFFDAVTTAAECSPKETLFVGDDVANDYAAAEAAGLQSILVDPHNRHAVNVARRVTKLDDVMVFV